MPLWCMWTATANATSACPGCPVSPAYLATPASYYYPLSERFTRTSASHVSSSLIWGSS
jgi:hypothetical protein